MKQRVLIVDDREENLYLLRSLLEGHGYEVAAAANGAEALASAREYPPVLIISDILMPVMDGFALCREWKRDERLKSIPFIFYTATYTDDRDGEFARSLGAERFVVKPQEPEAFLAIIEKTLSEVESRGTTPGQPPTDAAVGTAEEAPEEERTYLKQYSEALVRKLEAKMQQLADANRALEQDIAARREAEQAAAQHAHFLEQLLEAIPVPVFFKDKDLHYLGCNTAFAESVGLSKEQIIGSSVMEVHEPEFAGRFHETDRALLQQPDGRHWEENEVYTRAHPTRSMLTHKAVFRDVDGTLAGIVGVSFDTTDIHQAERDLEAGAMRLRRVLHGAVEALGATIEMRDPYTAGHQRRVAELACAIAKELGWPDSQIETLRMGALLHDIGKAVVPAEILSKPGQLSDNEIKLIRQHAAAGAETVAGIDFEAAIADIIGQHHERLDGSGYPAGLNGDEILPESRVLAIADVVEAMTSFRPYRPARSLDEALAEIQGGAGSRYDPDACAACVRLFREHGFRFSAPASAAGAAWSTASHA